MDILWMLQEVWFYEPYDWITLEDTISTTLFEKLKTFTYTIHTIKHTQRACSLLVMSYKTYVSAPAIPIKQFK